MVCCLLAGCEVWVSVVYLDLAGWLLVFMFGVCCFGGCGYGAQLEVVCCWCGLLLELVLVVI